MFTTQQPKLLIAVIAIVSMFSACKKIKDAANIDLNLTYGQVTFTIPQITAAGASTLGESNVRFDIDSLIKKTNSALSMANIKSVKVTSCVVEILDGDVNNNFSALSSAKVSLSSNVNSTKTLVAEIASNPDVEAYSLTIPVNTTIELKDYFKATNFTYTIEGVARKTTSKPLSAKATIKYKLNAGL